MIIRDNQNLTKVIDKDTGQEKHIDLSSFALSQILESIKQNADIINNQKNNFENIFKAYINIEELILTHARYSDKLQNMSIKINNKFIEPVTNFDGFQTLKVNYVRNYFITKSNKALDKITDITEIKDVAIYLNDAMWCINKGLEFIKDDELLIGYGKTIEMDINDLNIKKQTDDNY